MPRYIKATRIFLLGKNEVPPNNSHASGKALLVLSPDETRLKFTISTQGLLGITSAHFHEGVKGENGPIVKTIRINPVTGMAHGVWSVYDQEPLTSELVHALKTGGIYINVHTVRYPDGEIRGQVTF